MASGLYDFAKQEFLSANLDLTTILLKAVLVDAADYTVNLATHQDLADVASAGRVSTTAALAGKSVTGGVFDATDSVFASATGDQSEAVIIYFDSTVEATSTLIVYIDSGTGLPVTPSGADINLLFDNGANKIFKL